MILLADALAAWGSDDVESRLKIEMEKLDSAVLPLQQGLSTGSYALGDKFSVMIIKVGARENTLSAKAGIFYAGAIPGCSCSDDPTPDEEYAEYCEVEVSIDRCTGEALISLAHTAEDEHG